MCVYACVCVCVCVCVSLQISEPFISAQLTHVIQASGQGLLHAPSSLGVAPQGDLHCHWVVLAPEPSFPFVPLTLGILVSS